MFEQHGKADEGKYSVLYYDRDDTYAVRNFVDGYRRALEAVAEFIEDVPKIVVIGKGDTIRAEAEDGCFLFPEELVGSEPELRTNGSIRSLRDILDRPDLESWLANEAGELEQAFLDAVQVDPSFVDENGDWPHDGELAARERRFFALCAAASLNPFSLGYHPFDHVAGEIAADRE